MEGLTNGDRYDFQVRAVRRAYTGPASTAQATPGICAGSTATPSATSSEGLVKDCEALLAARDQIRGASALNWSKDLAIGSWTGVFLVDADNVATGRVTTLHLAGTESAPLTGSLPAVLGDLDALETLLISGTSLTGSLPAEIGDLDALETLVVQNTRTLTGSLPAEIGGLESLRSLVLRNTGFTGSMPASLGDLSNLTTLVIADTPLSGAIPTTLEKLSNLETLSITSTGVTGSIPSQLGSLVALKQLVLLGNASMSGAIPTTLGNLANLEDLALAGAPYTGAIPTELGGLKKLKNLTISGTAVNGAIPAELGNLAALETLNLAANKLTGGIPSKLAGLTKVTALALASANLTNKLTGEVTLTVSPTAVSEGDGATTITVTAQLDAGSAWANKFSGRGLNSDGEVVAVPAKSVINVSVAGSGVEGAVGFADVADFAITIPNGESSAEGTFTLTPTDNTEYETDETVTASLSSETDSVGADAIAYLTLRAATPLPTVTLTNDDAAQQAELTAIAITSTPEADDTYRSKATRRMITYCSGEVTTRFMKDGTDVEKVFKTVTSPPCETGQTEVTVATAVINVTHEEIEVTVTFDEAVTVTTGAVADTGVPYLKLDVGGDLVAAQYKSGSGTKKLVFRYTIMHRDRDADGVSIPENPIVLLGGASSIRNVAGQDAAMNFAGLGDQSGHKVDGAVPEIPVTGGTTPMITKISVESTPAAGTTYGAGEHIDVLVKWSEMVGGLDHPYPSLKLTVGPNTRTALLTSHRGDESRFRYAVQADDATAAGFSVSVPKDPLTVPEDSFIRSHYNSSIDAVTTYAGLAAAQIGHEVNGSVDNIRPNRPEGLKASGGLSVGAGGAYTHWLDLRWDHRPNRRDGTIIRYEYQLKDGEWTPIPGSGSTTTSLRFTIARKDYGANPIKVRAVDKGGASEESAAANVSWRDRVPYPAMGLQAAAGANSGEVTLTWNEPADDSTVTRYQYQYRRSPAWHGERYNMPWTTIPGSGSTTTSHTFTGLDGDVQYYFRIRPVNDVGQAPPTDEVGAIPQ